MTEPPSDDEYETPLQFKRPFGAGIKRKRINFVPQLSAADSLASASTNRPARSAADAYLAIVLPKPFSEASEKLGKPEEAETNHSEGEKYSEILDSLPLCPVCNLRKPPAEGVATMPHEASIAHQICLEQSHPPSALDRRRKGLAYLQSYGWDPDSRRGLGAKEEGRLYPVRAQKRHDNRGIGAPKETPREESRKAVSLTRKERKKAEEEAKKNAAKMRDLFYGRDEVNKYLGVEL